MVGYPHRVEQRTIGDDLLRVSLALSSGCLISILSTDYCGKYKLTESSLEHIDKETTGIDVEGRYPTGQDIADTIGTDSSDLTDSIQTSNVQQKYASTET